MHAGGTVWEGRQDFKGGQAFTAKDTVKKIAGPVCILNVVADQSIRVAEND